MPATLTCSCRRNTARAQFSTVTTETNTPSADALLEEIQQLLARVSVYRKLVNRLLEEQAI